MTEGNINALSPEAVKKPVAQKPNSTTSPLPEELPVLLKINKLTVFL